eukprot:m51a1_g7807 hypothetical protein (437) ;mRNA; f:82040-84457
MEGAGAPQRQTERALDLCDAGDHAGAVRALTPAPPYAPGLLVLRRLRLSCSEHFAPGAPHERALLDRARAAAEGCRAVCRAYLEGLVAARPAPSSRWLLGYWYDRIELDDPRAAVEYEAAAAAGNVWAASCLGFLLLTSDAAGRGCKDVPRAVRLLQFAVDAGDAQAAVNLGFQLESGDGVRRDRNAAARLYGVAAAKRNVDGMYNLSLCLAEGRGVEKDVPRAMALLETAARDYNDGAAGVRAALCYRDGEGVAPDEAKAREMLREWCDRGCPEAMLHLSEMLVASDPRESARLLRASADAGLDAARCAIAEQILQEPHASPARLAEAVRLLRLAQRDDARARFFLAQCCLEGTGGVARGVAEAVRLLESSCDADCEPQACMMMGLVLLGKALPEAGLAMDARRAYDLLVRAYEDGDLELARFMYLTLQTDLFSS